MSAASPRTFLSRYCLDVCTSHACDTHGDCPALAFQRSRVVEARVGEVVSYLARSGPRRSGAIVEEVFFDVPYPERLPEWQRAYLRDVWEKVLVRQLHRFPYLFLGWRGGDGALVWYIPEEPQRSELLTRWNIALPDVTWSYERAIQKVRGAEQPLALPELLATEGIEPTTSDYGRHLAELAERLGVADLACVLVDPRSGLGWRWWTSERVPRKSFPGDPPPPVTPREPDENTAKIRLVVHRANLGVGVLPVGTTGREVLPGTPNPAYLRLIDLASGVEYPVWYDPGYGMLYELDEFFAMNVVTAGTRLIIEPLDALGVYAIERTEIDAQVAERERPDAPRRSRAGLQQIDPLGIVVGDVRGLSEQLARSLADEKDMTDRARRLRARLQELKCQLWEDAS